MNISIVEYVVFALAASAAILLSAVALGRHLREQTLPVEEEGADRPLVEFRHRESLTQLLQLNRITGDADIREGRVYPILDKQKTSAHARMLMSAFNQAINNGALPSHAVYFAIPYEGSITGWAYKFFGDFGISDAQEIASLLSYLQTENRELRRQNDILRKELAE